MLISIILTFFHVLILPQSASYPSTTYILSFFITTKYTFVLVFPSCLHTLSTLSFHHLSLSSSPLHVLNPPLPLRNPTSYSSPSHPSSSSPSPPPIVSIFLFLPLHIFQLLFLLTLQSLPLLLHRSSSSSPLSFLSIFLLPSFSKLLPL